MHARAHTDTGIYIRASTLRDVTHPDTHQSRHRFTHGQPPRHTQMCSQAPANTRTHTHTANSRLKQAAGPLTCAHTHPLGSHRLHTVSGRFLSLSSLRSKHWLRMGFSELHMVCEGRAGVTVEAQGQAGQLSGAEIIQSPDPQPSPRGLPHLLQVPEEKVVVFIQKP